MKRFFAALALVSPSLAQGAELGILRPLQHGPIGDNPQFIDIKDIEVEGMVQTSQIWGKNKLNDDTDRQVQAFGYKMNVAGGGGWAPTKNLILTGYFNATLGSDFDEKQTRGERDATLDSGLYRHEFAFFTAYKSNPIVLGGGVGMIVLGGEDRLFKLNDSGAVTQSFQMVSRAALPTLRLFGGITTKPFDGTLGVRFFSKGDAVVSTYDKEDGKKTGEYDIVRRNPGEVHLDGRIKFDDGFVSGSLAYVLQGQASENINEFSTKYSQVGTVKTRLTGSEIRNQDQFRVGIGGRFEPIKILGLMGGLSYLSPFYAKPAYASVEHENLGGVRMDFGGELSLKPFNGYLQMGYLMDSQVSSTATTADRSYTRVSETQNFPVEEGDRVKTSQGRWDIALGGGMVF